MSILCCSKVASGVYTLSAMFILCCSKVASGVYTLSAMFILCCSKVARGVYTLSAMFILCCSKAARGAYTVVPRRLMVFTHFLQCSYFVVPRRLSVFIRFVQCSQFIVASRLMVLHVLQVIEMRHTSRLLMLLLLLLTELLSQTDARTIRPSDAIRPEIGPTRRGMCHSRPTRLLRMQLSSDFHQTRMSLVEPDQNVPDDLGLNNDGRRLASPMERIQNGGHIGADTTRHSLLNATTRLQRLLQRAKEASAAADNSSTENTNSSSTDTTDSSSPNTSPRSLPDAPHSAHRIDADYFAEDTSSANFRLPWKCQMESVWKKMPAGIFPPYVQTGRCVQRTCMFGACVTVFRKNTS